MGDVTLCSLPPPHAAWALQGGAAAKPKKAKRPSSGGLLGGAGASPWESEPRVRPIRLKVRRLDAAQVSRQSGQLVL